MDNTNLLPPLGSIQLHTDGQSNKSVSTIVPFLPKINWPDITNLFFLVWGTKTNLQIKKTEKSQKKESWALKTKN